MQCALMLRLATASLVAGSVLLANAMPASGSLPSKVDLTATQTPFRNQGARDTCTVFAAVAAVEAAYMRKYGLSLDLSEQYLNHVQKSFWLNFNQPLPFAEIQPETNGGGTIGWQFAVLGRYGLPPESSLPYIGDGSWQNLAGWTSPNGVSVQTLQRDLDDFMLSSMPRTYSTPSPIVATVLPLAALANARYRPTSTTMASPADLANLDWFRAQLSANREVAFVVKLTGPDPSEDGIWNPGPTSLGKAHGMLMVGYDDAQRVFLVKNQWGGQQFDRFSYDWVLQGLVDNAGVVLDVADPHARFGTFENRQLFLGRWNLDHDGWRGTLDIYRLPGDGSASAPDRRIGTYFGPDGVARRVNGAMDGNRIDFYIDWNVPDQPATVLQGMHFTGFILSKDIEAIAGSMLDNRDGSTYAFTALKSRSLKGVPSNAVSAYRGTWQLSADGIAGTLTLDKFNTSGDAVQGTFSDGIGNTYKAYGTIGPNPRAFTFTIATPTPKTLSGYLNGHEPAVMSGTFTAGGPPFGFYAVRVGDPR